LRSCAADAGVGVRFAKSGNGVLIEAHPPTTSVRTATAAHRPGRTCRTRLKGILKTAPAVEGFPRMHKLHTVSAVVRGQDLRDSSPANTTALFSGCPHDQVTLPAQCRKTLASIDRVSRYSANQAGKPI
jgi:hypothetical protein